jgi:hypothetical protein
MESTVATHSPTAVLAIQEELISLKQQLNEIAETLRTPSLSEQREIAIRSSQVALLQKERDLKAEMALYSPRVVSFPTGILVSDLTRTLRLHSIVSSFV